VKKQSKPRLTRQIQARLRELLEENLESIGRGLIQKATEGNYNAAQLLVRLSGIDDDCESERDTKADEDRQLGRMFFLEMAGRMLDEHVRETKELEAPAAKLAELPVRSKTTL
jgi:hypothetical protein